ncbi:hypothetical protein KKF55_03825 [Patescibacteria group bacterium]|nr:hypothetical protein [Patescibacteria group bacterium]
MSSGSCESTAAFEPFDTGRQRNRDRIFSCPKITDAARTSIFISLLAEQIAVDKQRSSPVSTIPSFESLELTTELDTTSQEKLDRLCKCYENRAGEPISDDIRDRLRKGLLAEQNAF